MACEEGRDKVANGIFVFGRFGRWFGTRQQLEALRK
jgi:hypothetical protein